MPIGTHQNNNFLRLTLDVWQDKVFHNEKEYPAGYFAAPILNTPMDEICASRRRCSPEPTPPSPEGQQEKAERHATIFEGASADIGRADIEASAILFS